MAATTTVARALVVLGVGAMNTITASSGLMAPVVPQYRGHEHSEAPVAHTDARERASRVAGAMAAAGWGDMRPFCPDVLRAGPRRYVTWRELMEGRGGEGAPMEH